jgi:diguanylate cyclase (GGDEF)-like protein
LKQPQSALDCEPVRLPVRRVRGKHAGDGEGAHGRIRRARDPRRAGAGARGDEEALALARSSKSRWARASRSSTSRTSGCGAREFAEALALSRQSLSLATEYNNIGYIATSKANIGFALFGLGRASEGKRYADEAVAEYERTGATAEIASLLGEYGQYLEKAGDYRTALAFFHRERKLYEEMAGAAHQRSVLEMQEKYESDKSGAKSSLLNRQNALTSAELENQALRERVWWLVAAVFAIALVVTGVYYRRLRVNSGLLAQRNRELSVRSSRDPLTGSTTGAISRNSCATSPLSRAPARGEPERSIQALLLIDIDLFKQTNDRYGHAAGEAVLVAVARRLRETLRETDMIVRWGGEEFLVFVPATSADKLDEIAARIMASIGKESIDYNGHPIRVTASVGYAPVPLPPENIHLAVGARCRPRRHGALHGQAPWSQLRLRHPGPACAAATTRRWPASKAISSRPGRTAWSRCTSSPAQPSMPRNSPTCRPRLLPMLRDGIENDAERRVA